MMEFFLFFKQKNLMSSRLTNLYLPGILISYDLCGSDGSIVELIRFQYCFRIESFVIFEAETVKLMLSYNSA